MTSRIVKNAFSASHNSSLANHLRQDSFRYLCFSDYKDYYTDTSVKFIISMTEDKLAEAEQSGLHKKFKLESTISTSNMVRFLGETRSFDNYSG